MIDNMNKLYVSIDFAKILTKPVIVTSENILHLTKCVINGPAVHPGADRIVRRGSFVMQMHNNECNLKLGDIVTRHIINDDIIIYRNLKWIVSIDPKLKVGDVRISLCIPRLSQAMHDFDGSECDLD